DGEVVEKLFDLLELFFVEFLAAQQVDQRKAWWGYWILRLGISLFHHSLFLREPGFHLFAISLLSRQHGHRQSGTVVWLQFGGPLVVLHGQAGVALHVMDRADTQQRGPVGVGEGGPAEADLTGSLQVATTGTSAPEIPLVAAGGTVRF